MVIEQVPVAIAPSTRGRLQQTTPSSRFHRQLPDKQQVGMIRENGSSVQVLCDETLSAAQRDLALYGALSILQSGLRLEREFRVWMAVDALRCVSTATSGNRLTSLHVLHRLADRKTRWSKLTMTLESAPTGASKREDLCLILAIREHRSARRDCATLRASMLSNADNGIVRVGVALTNMVKGKVMDAPTPPRPDRSSAREPGGQPPLLQSSQWEKETGQQALAAGAILGARKTSKPVDRQAWKHLRTTEPASQSVGDSELEGQPAGVGRGEESWLEPESQ
ncbi:hypothetical protein L1887_57140 [Cichorium endivia]|nr:hypothetical protein L1887_57140 [Cichorium endivia]